MYIDQLGMSYLIWNEAVTESLCPPVLAPSGKKVLV